MLDALPTRSAVEPRRAAGAYKVDISRGTRIGRVSSEWCSRPDDERYLSLSALHEAVRARAAQATMRTVETASLPVQAMRDDAKHLTLVAPGRDEKIAPTHWSFSQLSSLIGAPAGDLCDVLAIRLADRALKRLRQIADVVGQFGLTAAALAVIVGQ